MSPTRADQLVATAAREDHKHDGRHSVDIEAPRRRIIAQLLTRVWQRAPEGGRGRTGEREGLVTISDKDRPALYIRLLNR